MKHIPCFIVLLSLGTLYLQSVIRGALIIVALWNLDRDSCLVADMAIDCCCHVSKVGWLSWSGNSDDELFEKRVSLIHGHLYLLNAIKVSDCKY